jgi:Lysylphosphatidylglycerol synthase TM region
MTTNESGPGDGSSAGSVWSEAPYKLRVGSIVGLAGGVLLFVWAVRAAGPGAVFDGVRRLGIGFAAVVILGGVRLFLRMLAWRLCLDSPGRLPLGKGFLAFIAGDSLGNVTPFGLLISEPSKVILTRRLVPPSISAAALTIENLFYTATVVVLLLSGTAALLFTFRVGGPIRIASETLLAGTVAFATIGLWIVVTRRRFVSGLCGLAIRHRIGRGYLAPRLGHIQQVEDQVFSFADRHPDKVLPVLGLEILFHGSAVAEIWLVLSFIAGAPASMLTAFVLEYVNRSLTSVFQFVPLWLGVDEAGTGLVTTALQLGPATGVSLALARKGRNLVWTATGLVLLLRQGLSVRSTVRAARALTPDQPR